MEDVGSSFLFFVVGVSVVLLVLLFNGSSSKMFIEFEKEDVIDDKKNGKWEKMFLCFK